MFKTEEQVNARLNSEKNLVNRFGVKNIPGTPNIPTAPAQRPISETPPLPQAPINDSVQSISPEASPVTIIPLQQPGNKSKPKLKSEQKNEIAIRSRLGENQSDLAKEFKVSQSAIGEIEQGRTKVDEDLVQEKVDIVNDVAMNKLLRALNFITDDKMEKSKATDLSMIASNMSKIVSNVRGKETDATRVIVQIYAPEVKSESSFKTIDV